MLCRCGFHVETERAARGLTLCLVCGDREAQKQIAIKQSQVGPAFNKGPVMYLGGENFRQNCLDSGKKTSNSAEVAFASGREQSVKDKQVKPSRRKVGIYYREGQAYALYEGDDPQALGASRWAKIR